MNLVREADPSGAVVAHAVLPTRMIDMLVHSGAITERQYTDATVLRDAWERAGLAIGFGQGRSYLRASFQGRPEVADEQAFAFYQASMRRLDPDLRTIVRAVVIDDADPADWGKRHRCHGLGMLRRALDMLSR